MGRLIATEDWQEVTLTADEKWQARVKIYIAVDDGTVTGDLEDDDGLLLLPGFVETIASGSVVRFKRAGHDDGKIWRQS